MRHGHELFTTRVGLLLEHRAFGETRSLFLPRTHCTFQVPISFTFTLCIRLLRCTGSGARFREPLLIYFRAAPPSHFIAGDTAALVAQI